MSDVLQEAVNRGEHERGVYEKFKVERTDGTSGAGEKHHVCSYFVLDLNHDPYAGAALEAYAEACEVDYPALARDLRILAASGDSGGVVMAMMFRVDVDVDSR